MTHQTLKIDAWWPEHVGPIDDARGIYNTRVAVAGVLSDLRAEALRRFRDLNVPVDASVSLGPVVE